MFGWSASNRLTIPWSTKSSPVLGSGRLVPSWGTAVAAGAGIGISGMAYLKDDSGSGEVCTRGGCVGAGRGVAPAEPRGAVADACVLFRDISNENTLNLDELELEIHTFGKG